MAIRVNASGARATSYGVERGVDVDVTCEIAGLTCEGEVTLVTSRGGGYEAYGYGPNQWVSGALLQWMRTLDDSVSLADMLRDLESAAARCASHLEAVA